MAYKLVMTTSSEKRGLFGSKIKSETLDPLSGFASPEEARDWWNKTYKGLTDLEADLERGVFYARVFDKKGWQAWYGRVVEQEEEKQEEGE